MTTRRGFAADTEVTVERSKQAIERLLQQHGAQGFHTGWQSPAGDDPGWDAVEFLWKDRQIRFKLAKPSPTRIDAKGKKAIEPWAVDKRSPWRMAEGAKLQAAIDQKNRQRWRVLFLVIKAKLEAVEAGVSIFEEEFLAFIVTAKGMTVGEALVPMIRAGSQLLLGAGNDAPPHSEG